MTFNANFSLVIFVSLFVSFVDLCISLFGPRWVSLVVCGLGYTDIHKGYLYAQGGKKGLCGCT